MSGSDLKRKTPSSNYGEVLDSCDNLRTLVTLNINELIGLNINEMIDNMIPTIVVIGDQSSGKSSLISAIAGISSPIGSNRTTSCRCEIRLRKGDESKKIWVEDNYGNEVYRENYTDESFVNIHNKVIADSTSKNVIFNRDYKIVLEIKSLTTNDMTLIDLPGLIYGNTDEQKNEQKAVVDMVLEYIFKPNSIIVHVISVADDISTRISRDACNKIDPQRLRTITVLTKADKAKITSEARAFALEEVKDIYTGIFVQMREAINDTWVDITENKEETIWKTNEWTNFQKQYTNIHYGRKNFRKILSDKLEEMVRKETYRIVNNLEMIVKKLDEKLTNELGRHPEKTYQIFTKWNNSISNKIENYLNNSKFRIDIKDLYTQLNNIIPDNYPLSLKDDIISKEIEEIRGDSIPFITGCSDILRKYINESVQYISHDIYNWVDNFVGKFENLICYIHNTPEITPKACHEVSKSLIIKNNEKLADLKKCIIEKINMHLNEIHTRPFVLDNDKLGKAILLSRVKIFEELRLMVNDKEKMIRKLDNILNNANNYIKTMEGKETIIKIQEYWRIISPNTKEVIVREFRMMETQVINNIKNMIMDCDISLIKESQEIKNERDKLLKAESICHESLNIFRKFI